MSEYKLNALQRVKNAGKVIGANCTYLVLVYWLGYMTNMFARVNTDNKMNQLLSTNSVEVSWVWKVVGCVVMGTVDIMVLMIMMYILGTIYGYFVLIGECIKGNSRVKEKK